MADKKNNKTIEELEKASESNVSVNIVDKSFDKAMLKRLKVAAGSMIAKCTFKEASIFACNFNETTFLKCNFTNADLYGVKFDSCTFNECTFNEANFERVEFTDSCVFTSCNFSKINVFKDVIGLNDKDFNVISEQQEAEANVLDAIGFKHIDKDEYAYKTDDESSYVSVCYDPDLGLFRELVLSNGYPVFTYDLCGILAKADDADEVNKMKILLANGIKLALSKIDDEKSINILNDIIGNISK